MIRKLIIVSASALIASSANAEIYKCTQGGKTIYSERPCGADAKTVQTQGDITEEQRAQARAIARSEQRMRGDIEYQEQMDRIEREKSGRAYARAAKAKQDKCAGYERKATQAGNEASTYRYHQGLIDDANRRKKENEDRHFSECYSR